MEKLIELTDEELKTVEGGSLLIVIAALIGIGIGIWAGMREEKQK